MAYVPQVLIFYLSKVFHLLRIHRQTTPNFSSHLVLVLHMEHLE